MVESFVLILQTRPYVPYALVMSTTLLLTILAIGRWHRPLRHLPWWDRVFLAPLILPPILYVLHWWLTHTPGRVAWWVHEVARPLGWLHNVSEQLVFLPVFRDLTGLLLGFAGARLLLRLWAVRRLLRRCSPVPGALPAWQRALAAVPGLRRPPALLAVADPTPRAMTAGFFRPTVILSTALLETLDEDEQTVVLVHELAHIRRGDPAITWLLLWLLDLICFSPAAWYACRRLLANREYRCDDLAVAWTGQRYHLASSLIKVRLIGEDAGLSSSAQLRGGEVQMRVERLLAGSRETASAAAANSPRLTLQRLGLGVTLTGGITLLLFLA